MDYFKEEKCLLNIFWCFLFQMYFRIPFKILKHNRDLSHWRMVSQSFPDGPMVESLPSIQEVQVWSLVRELKSHITCSQKTKKNKHKQYCKIFNKDFKNGPYKQKILKKNIAL